MSKARAVCKGRETKAEVEVEVEVERFRTLTSVSVSRRNPVCSCVGGGLSLRSLPPGATPGSRPEVAVSSSSLYLRYPGSSLRDSWT